MSPESPERTSCEAGALAFVIWQRRSEVGSFEPPSRGYSALQQLCSGAAVVVMLRIADRADDDAVWAMLEPVVRAGEEFALPRDMQRDAGLAYWFAAAHEVFVADVDGVAAGSYFLRANQSGGGDHVANCGYMTLPAARGQGIARAMLEHSLQRARERGFRAMQFNFVVSSNERAVKTWGAYGFEVVGRLPGAFRHPTLGSIDAFVMYRTL